MREANPVKSGRRGRQQNKSLALCAKIGDRTGGSIVELALVAPIFAVLLVGAADFAIVEYAAIETSNAAVAGAEYGSETAASSLSSTQITAMQTAATNDGANVPGLAATGKQFWSCSSVPSTQYSTSAAAGAACAVGDHVLHYVQVTTTATATPPVHVPGLSSSYTVTGKAIMRVL